MQIDLNADLGEGCAHDVELLALVSSANISCGAHAGDANSIASAIRLALANGVGIGAHPSFPDRSNFGRATMQLPFSSLRTHLLYQLHGLRDLVTAQNARLSHIKPHGALYNQLAVDAQLAHDFVRIMKEFDPQLPIVSLAGGVLHSIARDEGLHTRQEAFADRRYRHDGTLVPRTDAAALISNPTEAIEQCLRIITRKELMSVDGQPVRLQADTLCLHGDSPQALAFAQRLHGAFGENNISIKARA